MRLILQTNISGRLDVWLVRRDQIIAHTKKSVSWHGSERLLPMIEQVLKKNKRPTITDIIVVRGPGPFTAVRTGIVTANTLGWLTQTPVSGVVRSATMTDQEILKLPILTRKTFLAVRPHYGRAPNITKPKR